MSAPVAIDPVLALVHLAGEMHDRIKAELPSGTNWESHPEAWALWDLEKVIASTPPRTIEGLLAQLRFVLWEELLIPHRGRATFWTSLPDVPTIVLSEDAPATDLAIATAYEAVYRLRDVVKGELPPPAFYPDEDEEKAETVQEASEGARLNRILAAAQRTDLTVDFLEALTRDMPPETQEKVLENLDAYPRHMHIVRTARIAEAQAA
jgi:hypothetical protein